MGGLSARRLIPAVVAAMSALPGAHVQAADLFVAGTIGEVYLGDPQTGGFEHFGGICLSPIRSMAIDDANIYAGDLNGGIIRLDLTTGEFMDLFFVPGSNSTDIVVHEGWILVSSTSSNVKRVDPTNGEVATTLSSPIQIGAMAIDGMELFIGGPLGAIYKGDAATGGFQFFGAGAQGTIAALALDGSIVYAADEQGLIVRFDRTTGGVLNSFAAPGDVTALQLDGAQMLVSEHGGEIHRLNAQDGTLIGTLTSPVFVDAMEMLVVVGDLDGDRHVGITDFLMLLASWGPCPAPPAGCPGDLNGDGSVGTADFLALLGNWG